MAPGGVVELIWHFAGAWHLIDDVALDRVAYDEGSFSQLPSADRVAPEHGSQALADLPDVTGQSVGFVDVAGAGLSGAQVRWAKLHDAYPVVAGKSYAAHPFLGGPAAGADMPDLPDLGPGRYIHGLHYVHAVPHTAPTEAGPAAPRLPSYVMTYDDAHAGEAAKLVQVNALADRDSFSDGPADGGLHPIDSTPAMAAMLDAAKDVNPAALWSPDETGARWTSAVVTHDDAMASGQARPDVLAPGTYVNGELRAGDAPDSVHGAGAAAPLPPLRDNGSTDPGQVAETGANQAHNAAVLADMNESPQTLIVHGNYYQTDAILQANVLQDRDHVFDAGGSAPSPVEAGGNRADNIATFDVEQLAKAGGSHSYQGNLNVHVDFVDGDFVDVKSVTQRNNLDDGDVTLQTRSDSYAQVHSGGSTQDNVSHFVDWGKHYDVIVVLGDYHSANIISQLNVVLDDDVVGRASGPGQDSLSGLFTGQNALQNQAAIHNYGATTFNALTGDLSGLVDGLKQHDTLGRDAWAGFHGAASGNLDVLFVRGDYYDLNIVNQVNVIADADLAMQTASGGSALQWLSTGGNVAANSAEILNAGGMYDQYVGGGAYHDSILLQANLVSDATHTTAADPTALVSEAVAFMDHGPGEAAADAAPWTRDVFTNHHDAFGHVLT